MINDYKLDVSFSELINTYISKHPDGDRAGVKKAWQYANEKHSGVKRGSGEPYINHPLRVARILANQGFDSEYLMAALLHDVVEDCDVPLSEIRYRFGNTVAEIVDAVTALSDRDFNGEKLSKKQLDTLSDARLQDKMTIRALYVKIADRIDNLSTLSGVKEEKRMPKAEHTREILIPMAKKANAYHCVDMLEELCFRAEHPLQLAEMEKIRDEINLLNHRSTGKSLAEFERVFDPLRNNCAKELEPYHRHIISFRHQDRSMISLYRQITANTDKLDDLRNVLVKDNFAFHDLFLIVSNDLEEEGTPIRPHDLFFKYFDLVLSVDGFYIVDYRRTTHKDSTYFLIADQMDNLFRLFIRTRDENDRYQYGNILDNSAFFPGLVNEIEPRDTYSPKMKVFCADGTATLIDRGATVLDFAFHIHTDLGLHFKYAQLNDNKTQLPHYTRLNDGDKVYIEEDEKAAPSFIWFKYVRTSRATDRLIRYFEHLYANERGCPFV